MSGMWSLPSAQYQATASPAEPRARSVPVSGGTGSGGGSGRGSNSGGGDGGTPSTSSLSIATSSTHGGIPEPPTTFGELELLSVRELQGLLQDRAKFEHFITTHAHTRAVEAAIVPLRREVEALGESDSVDASTIEALENEVEELRKVRSDWMARNTEFHLESRLVALIDEGEHESAALVDEWRQGVVGYHEFISKYVTIRTRIAERKLKLDSFREKMQRAKRRS